MVILQEIIDKKECLVCEFSNGDKAVSVGYRAWLQQQSNNEELDKIIDKGTEVKIKWANCDLTSATSMTKANR